VSQKNDNMKIEKMASELGLVNVWAYHCSRCNYTWLPKDFDLGCREPFELEGSKSGQELLYRPPPKSCARCKSRSWNIPPHKGSERGQSKTKIKASERRDKLTSANLTRNLNALEHVGVRFNRNFSRRR
jgi:hypothetical protein